MTMRRRDDETMRRPSGQLRSREELVQRLAQGETKENQMSTMSAQPAAEPLYRTLHRAAFAACIILAPLLLALWFGLCPQYGDPACPNYPSYHGALAAFRAANPFLLQVFLVNNIVVPYLYPLSYIGLGLLAMKRSPWLSTIGIACGFVGSIVWSLIADQSFLLTSMARLDQDPLSMRVLMEYGKNWEPWIMGGGWVIGHLLGYVLLGIALWRAQVSPRWAAGLIIVAAPVMGPLAYGTHIGALQILGYVMVFIGSIPAVGALLRARDEAMASEESGGASGAASEIDLRTYSICLLRKGPAWTAEETRELEQLQAQHVAYTRQKVASGAAIAAGPVTDGGDIRGFSIFRTATLAEARAIAEADPGVRAGRFVVELHPWMTPAGVLPDPAIEMT